MRYTEKGKWILILAAILTIILGTLWVGDAGMVKAQTLTGPEQEEADIRRFTEPVIPQYDATSTFFIIKVNVHKDETALTKQFLQDSNGKYTLMYDVLGGYSNMRFRPVAEVPVAMNEEMDGLYVCEMNVVQPSVYYDPAWYTIGHEFGHCMYGQWHIPSLIENNSEE